MSIVDYLYKGAPAGERAAVQKTVQNMPYSTILKNIADEGAFGFGKNLKGFDFNYKGTGALPTNTFFQKYIKNPATYITGGISSLFGGKASGNIGGGTGAQRQLFEKVLQNPVVRTAGPVVRTALSIPMTLAVSGPYGISKLMEPRTEAGLNFMKNYDKGAITSISDETAGLDFQDFGNQLLAVDAANQVPANQVPRGGIIEATPFFSSQDIAARNVGVPRDGRLTGIMRNVARGPLFSGGVQAGLTASELLTGAASLPFALAGGVASQFLPLGRSKPDFDYQYVNDPDNMGGLSVVDNKIVDPSGILSGKNFESAFGSKNLGEMYDKEIDRLGGFITALEEEEEKKGGLSKKDAARLDRLKTKQQLARNRLGDYLYSGPTIGNTGITYKQFARDYNRAQQNIGSNYDALDAQSYSSLGGGEQTTTVDGQDITSYTDPYDPGTDD
jgi:hypothetical protein